jgi:hypothetical protein
MSLHVGRLRKRRSAREGDRCSSLGDNLVNTVDYNSFVWSKASLGAYSTYKRHMEHFLLYCMHVM